MRKARNGKYCITSFRKNIYEIMENIIEHNEPVNIDCKIEDLITTSMNQNFVPVIDDKKIFIGIVTRRDIIQYCYDQVQKENLAR